MHEIKQLEQEQWPSWVDPAVHTNWSPLFHRFICLLKFVIYLLFLGLFCVFIKVM